MNKDQKEDIVEGLRIRLGQVIDRYGSQSELAVITGISKASISAIMLGKIKNPSFDLLYRVLMNTDVRAQWLMTGYGEMTRSSEVSNNGLATQEVEKEEKVKPMESDQCAKYISALETIKNISETMTR